MYGKDKFVFLIFIKHTYSYRILPLCPGSICANKSLLLFQFLYLLMHFYDCKMLFLKSSKFLNHPSNQPTTEGGKQKILEKKIWLCNNTNNLWGTSQKVDGFLPKIWAQKRIRLKSQKLLFLLYFYKWRIFDFLVTQTLPFAGLRGEDWRNCDRFKVELKNDKFE